MAARAQAVPALPNSAHPRPEPPSPERHAASLVDSGRGAVAIAFLLAIALSWPRILAVWSHGVLFDTDDAMRLSQIRDWLNGQGWFDLTARRIDPPAGIFMHWTRVVDVLVGPLIKAFALFVDPAMAERLARLVYSLAWQWGLIAATCWAAEALLGRRAVFPTALLTALSGMTFGVFQPGRIDHDSIQITMFVLAFGYALRSLDPARPRWALGVGAFSAVALATGLEELPFLAVVFCALPTAWIMRGDALRRAMSMLGAGILPSVALAFVATVGPARWAVTACDQLSFFHVTTLGLGALCCLALALASPFLRTAPARLTCAGALGAAVVCVAAIYFPECLRSPYASVDPFVREHWLDYVTEARPLFSVLAERPSLAPLLLAPTLLGLIGLADGGLRTQGAARDGWLLSLCLSLVGFALACWENRAMTSLTPIVLLGGARCFVLARTRRGVASAALAAAAIVFFSPVSYALLPLGDDNPTKTRAAEAAAACRAPQSFAAIAALPPGLILAPVNAGAHLLAYTRDSVLAAPYHRNNAGNRFALEAMRSDPNAARERVEAAGVRYVAVCDGLDPDVAHGSLAEALAADHPPSWLSRLPLVATPFKIYQVQ